MSFAVSDLLSRFGEKGGKEPTKGVLELPLETPFPLDPPGPSIADAQKYFVQILCSYMTHWCVAQEAGGYARI